MTISLVILAIGLLCVTAYAINLNIKVFNAQVQLDRHQITIDRFTSLDEKVNRLTSRMQRLETLSASEIADFRDDMDNFIAHVRDAIGVLNAETSIPSDYDDVPNYDYRNDPGGQTIEDMLAHERNS